MIGRCIVFVRAALMIYFAFAIVLFELSMQICLVSLNNYLKLYVICLMLTCLKLLFGIYTLASI